MCRTINLIYRLKPIGNVHVHLRCLLEVVAQTDLRRNNNATIAARVASFEWIWKLRMEFRKSNHGQNVEERRELNYSVGV
jgi:hypothetical protein